MMKTSSTEIQRRVLISGRVQGVGFRQSLFKEAEKVSVRGFVRNLKDGRVEAVFLGSPETVLKLTAWCKHGPALAKVSVLEVKEEPLDLSLGRLKIL